MSGRNRNVTDEYQLRRRTNVGHVPDSFPVGDTGNKSGMESHDIAQGIGTDHPSSSTTSIANQKAKVKSEALSPTPENLSEKIRVMGMLTAQAQQLGEEQSMHAERIRKLDEEIKQGELKHGKMLQDYLGLQRALELKKKHINEDTEARKQELLSHQRKTEQIRSIIAQVNAIATEENHELPTDTSSK